MRKEQKGRRAIPTEPTPSLREQCDGLRPRNTRTGKLRLMPPNAEPPAQRRADPLAGYDPFTPRTNYAGRY